MENKELKDRFSVALEGIEVNYENPYSLEDLGKGRGRKKPANA